MAGVLKWGYIQPIQRMVQPTHLASIKRMGIDSPSESYGMMVWLMGGWLVGGPASCPECLIE